MNAGLSELRRALLATLILAVVCCGVYPLVVYGVAQLAFADQANGSLLVGADGAVRGSRLIGQTFTDARYFHPRPSAAGSGYDAASSGGSNLGPTSQKLHDLVAQRIADYRTANRLDDDVDVPADAVTASGGGLDPHISPRNAELQVARVARARGMAEAQVLAQVARCTEAPQGGVLGEARVNVLLLNLALDKP